MEPALLWITHISELKIYPPCCCCQFRGHEDWRDSTKLASVIPSRPGLLPPDSVTLRNQALSALLAFLPCDADCRVERVPPNSEGILSASSAATQGRGDLLARENS